MQPTLPTECFRRRCVIGRELAIGRLLGSGANGEVYCATPQKSSVGKSSFLYPERLVVKVIRKEICTPQFVTFVDREVRSIQSLPHPFIVGYIGSWMEVGYGSFKGCYCIAMDYCNGGDLHSLTCEFALRKEHPPEDLIAMLMVHVFAALNFSHSQRIVHRDVKPANVFLSRDDTGAVQKAMVGDFGLSRPLEDITLTATTRVGTPCYCSPEIVLGENYTAKTDIFSAGVMFYELMFLERPFWKRFYTEKHTFRDILTVDPIPQFTKLLRRHYSRSLMRVVAACLRKRESERPSAYDVLTRISSRLTTIVISQGIPLYCTTKGSPLRDRRTSLDKPLEPIEAPPTPPKEPSPVSQAKGHGTGSNWRPNRRPLDGRQNATEDVPRLHPRRPVLRMRF